MENTYTPPNSHFLQKAHEKVVNLYASTSSVPAKISVPQPYQFNYVLLASVDTSTQSFSISTLSENDFKEKLTNWAFNKERDIFELKSVVEWQRKCLDYQSIYSAYLLGMLNEEEFERDSDEYASDIRDITKEAIVSTVDRLNRLVDCKFTVADIASYLQTDTSIVFDALEHTSNRIKSF